ncbi:hypothetical protein M404DRAFT_25707 [Pisolithus tinctorius Marx 270]|uniref:Uncharacterized protein n=1 Tax=Pisolithus tinctorius Marx 270 TaxID=870435 RepID=A0A0C3J7R7_PISTI|nr:hypothetical protein M404DRAFT_25707 [Pisolithus tinctorius Marx 270]
MSIHWSRMPYDQELLPDLTRVTSEELWVCSDDNDKAIWGKLAECKRHKAKVQEEAWLEAERQEQAWLKEERACTEAEAQRIEAEEARKAEESRQADALVGSSTGASSNVEVMNPQEKKKRSRHPSAKVLEGTGDEEDDVGEGLLTSKKAGAEVEAGPVTGAQMERLIKAVERIADNMAGLAMAQREVSWNFYQFAQSYKTYVKERFKFLTPDVPSDRDTTDEEDEDIEGLDDELEGLREEEEESQSWSESGDQASASSGSQA